MAELQPAVLFRYENWIHAVSQAESANEARIDVNVAFNGYRYWTLIFSQRASKGTGSRYQDGFVIGMSGGNNDTQNWIGEVEDLDVKMIRRGSGNFTATSGYVRDVTQYIGHIYYNWYHGYEDLVTYKFVCDTQTKTVRCYINQAYMGYGPLNFPTTEYSNGRLEVLKTWAQLGDSNCISYLGDVWLYGCQTLEDAEDYNGGYNPGHKSHGEFLVHHSSHPSGRKMVSDSSHRMYGWKIGDTYDPPVPPDPPEPALRTVTLIQTAGGTISASPMSGYDRIDTVTLSQTTWPDPQEGGYYSFQGYVVTGATLSGSNKFTFSGSDVTCSGTWNYVPPPPAPGPYTIRVRLKAGATPPTTFLDNVLVSASDNIWDCYWPSSNWFAMFENNNDLIEVIAADMTGVTSLRRLFNNCQNLEAVALFDTSSVTNMESTFCGCNKLSSIPLFDTSSVTTMRSIFDGCSSLTTVPLLDTSNASNMTYMFRDCTALTSIPLFNTSSANYMSEMFINCSSLNTVPLLDTSKVMFMDRMFKGCTALTSIPEFNTPVVTNMSEMFMNCSNLTTIPLLNTSKVELFASMFEGCTSLTSVPLLVTNRADNMADMFLGCTSLTTVPKFYTNGCELMSCMFKNCTALTSVPLFTTLNCESMNQMFYGCTSLTSVPLFRTDKCRDMRSMFEGCINVQSGALALYNRASSQSTVPSHSKTFMNCGTNTTTGRAELARIPSDWKS